MDTFGSSETRSIDAGGQANYHEHAFPAIAAELMQ